MKRQLIMTVLVAAMGMGVAQGAKDSIYGARLMTEQERATYQYTLSTMATEQERATYRAEHQAKIQVRAMAQAVDLNDAGDPVGTDGKPLRDRDRDRLQDKDSDQLRDQDRDRQHDGTGLGGGMGGSMGSGGRR